MKIPSHKSKGIKRKRERGISQNKVTTITPKSQIPIREKETKEVEGQKKEKNKVE